MRIQPGDSVTVIYVQPDDPDQKGDWAYVTMDQTREASTTKDTLNEEMLQTWIYTTTEIQTLLNQRRELTHHGTVDPDILRNTSPASHSSSGR